MSVGKVLCITGIVIFVIGIILMIALVVASYETVDNNQVGLDYDTTPMQLDETKLYDSGRYFIGVSHNFITYATDLSTMNFTDVLVRSRDGLALNISVSFQYKLISSLENMLLLVYTFPGGGEEDAYYYICRNVFRDSASRYEIFEFVNNRSEIESDLRTSSQEALAKYGASVESFQLTDIQYPTDFQDAISETQNAILAIQTAQFNQSKAEQQVEGLIQQAKTRQKVILNNAQIAATNLNQQAMGISNSMKQRISALKASLAQFAESDYILNKPDFLINYQWLQAIDQIQGQQADRMQMKVDLPRSYQCLYDNFKC